MLHTVNMVIVLDQWGSSLSIEPTHVGYFMGIEKTRREHTSNEVVSGYM